MPFVSDISCSSSSSTMFLDSWCRFLFLFLVVVKFHFAVVKFRFAVVLFPLVWLDCVDNLQYLFLEAIKTGVGCCLKLVVFSPLQVFFLCQLCLDLLVALPKYICGAVFLNIMTWEKPSFRIWRFKSDCWYAPFSHVVACSYVYHCVCPKLYSFRSKTKFLFSFHQHSCSHCVRYCIFWWEEI